MADETEAAAEAREQNRMERLIEYWDSLPDGPEKERVRGMIGKDFALEGDDASVDMLRADALRSGGAEGRQTRNAYVAASPLEHIASMLQNVKQQKAYDEAMGRRTGSREGADDQRGFALAELLRSKRGNYANPNPNSGGLTTGAGLPPQISGY